MSTTTPTGLSQSRTNVALITLFLGTFVLGSAELVVVGVLNVIASNLQVSVATAGSLVTAYALGLSIGGPILTALTIRVPRRVMLWLTLTLYILGTALAFLSVNFGMLVLARVLTGSLQGLFVGVAFTVATTIVPPERIGRAMSAVIGGFAVSTAIGVPLGTLIGQSFGWRGSFVAVAILGVVVLIAQLIVIPPVATSGATGLGDQAKFAFAPRVLAMLGLCILLFAGMYASLTFITPFLQQLTGISGGLISAFLLAYGAATAVGAFAGGRFADKNASRAILIADVVVVIALVVLYFVSAIPLLVAVALILWGLFGFGLVPSLQYRVVSLAGPGGNLAATLPASAINAGIAIGALIGGWALSSHGAAAPTVVGIIVCIVAIPVAWVTGFLKVPSSPAAADVPAPAEAAATEAASS